MKKKAIEYIIKRANKQGATEVRVNASKHTSPDTLLYRGSRKAFTPDLVAYFPENRDFFSIENTMSKSTLSENISKWILFSLEAKKYKGSFYIVVPEEKEKDFQNIVSSKQISAEIISI